MRSALLAMAIILGATGGSRGEVAMTFADPKTFTDFEYSQTRQTIDPAFFSREIKRYLERVVEKAFPVGVALKLDFQDIDLAGGFEPWQRTPLNDVRFFRSRYPPMVVFFYRVEDEEGNLLAEGEKRLRELAYQERFSRGINSRRNFYYERRILEHWIRGELVDQIEEARKGSKGNGA